MDLRNQNRIAVLEGGIFESIGHGFMEVARGARDLVTSTIGKTRGGGTVQDPLIIGQSGGSAGGMGGMDTTTLLLVGGMGLAAVLLLRPKGRR